MEALKKILVRLPLEFAPFSLFAFFIDLSERFPKADIAVIGQKGQTWIYHFLPVKVELFELPEGKMSLLEVHQYCVNNHNLFNIDLYLDLESSLNSSFLGFNFRSKKRYGFKSGINKFFYHKTIEDNGFDVESRAYQLLELFLNEEFNNDRLLFHYLKPIEESNVIPLFKKDAQIPFLFVMLKDFASVKENINFWKEFFDSFEKQRFVIWSEEDENVISDLFLSIDLGKNELLMHKGKDIGELQYILKKAAGIIATTAQTEGLCSYYCLDAVSLIFDERERIDYKRYECKPNAIVIHSEDEIEILQEENTLTDTNELVDYLHRYFKL